MKRVKVIFYLEPNDPEHSTGMTMGKYEEVNHVISGVLGGDDIDIEVVEVAEPDQTGRQKKPKAGN